MQIDDWIRQVAIKVFKQNMSTSLVCCVVVFLLIYLLSVSFVTFSEGSPLLLAAIVTVPFAIIFVGASVMTKIFMTKILRDLFVRRKLNFDDKNRLSYKGPLLDLENDLRQYGFVDINFEGQKYWVKGYPFSLWSSGNICALQVASSDSSANILFDYFPVSPVALFTKEPRFSEDLKKIFQNS